ncbi:hypothetical protein J4E83_010426 [Alternaria metachromatica]|uniref:uncharacterized protein n=1 Tax=Alternaria metachromatica TaxID=283354 RepID=UPI0020C4C92B|nr:uncharacterized protein J4E83_010426 [Alternaria metachromatica]KAI4605763.1 hypothetical protein J4E83_010426 [Alternaria metachromatica]
MARKRRSADSTPPPPRRQRPLLPGSPRARRDAHGNITNAAYLSEATLAREQNRPQVLATVPAPGPPAPRQQLAIHTRGEHADHPYVATNVQSGRRTAPRSSVHNQRYAPYSRAPPNYPAAHPGAIYTPPAVPAPASRTNFVEPQQQYQQYQHYPQHQFGNVLPDADLMRFPSNSSQATLGHAPSNAVGHQPSGNGFQDDTLRAEDFEEAGLNLEAFQDGVPDENGGDAQYQSDFLDFQKFLLHSSGDMSDGSYSLNQMASRPIFHRYPAPAPARSYQQPLREPTHAGYNVAGAYQSPYAPTMYAPQQAHFQPTFQPGPMYAPGPVNNVVMQQAGPIYAPGSVNNNFVQQPGTMYAPGYVENFVVQQPRPTARPRSGATYPVSYATTEEWVEAQRREEKRVSEGEDGNADGRGDG